MLTSLLSLALCAAPEPAAARVLVMPLDAQPSISRDLVDGASLVLVDQVRRHGGLKVSYFPDVASLLDEEARKQAAGCDDEGCVAQLAGALAVDQVIRGSLARVGSGWLVALSRISAKDAQVLDMTTRRVDEVRDSAVLDALPTMTGELFKETAAPPEGAWDRVSRDALGTLLNGKSGNEVASDVARVLHPVAHGAKLRAWKAVTKGDETVVDMDIRYQGLRDHHDVALRWVFTPRRHTSARVTSTDGEVAVACALHGHFVNAQFRRELFPRLLVEISAARAR